jgi:hypothetical protein
MNLIDKENIEILILEGKKIFIGTYGFNSLEPNIINYQKKVFDYFKIPINQFIGDVRHPEFMDNIIKNIDVDYFIFFDIDCIPLTSNVVEFLIDSIGEETMIGIEQQCNSKTNLEHIYAGPACFAISKKFYAEIGQPSFNETERSDVGEELTFACEKLGKPFKVIEKTNSEDEIWSLKGGRFFGHGTTYGDNIVYHQFEIRNYDGNFIKKCKEILNYE